MKKTTIKIVIMAAIIILMSFIPEMFPNFFGDWKCNGSGKFLFEQHQFERCNYAAKGLHESTYHWGFRHWVWFFTGLTLLIINIVNMVDKDSDK